jgi:hypothetical protein
MHMAPFVKLDSLCKKLIQVSYVWAKITPNMLYCTVNSERGMLIVTCRYNMKVKTFIHSFNVGPRLLI